MFRRASRALSLVVAAFALWVAWPIPHGLAYALVTVGSTLIPIWYPEDVDEIMYGTWQQGYRIDTHTPPVLIVVMGWVLLLLYTSFLADPDFLSRLFLP
jgi:hypothetical protein